MPKSEKQKLKMLYIIQLLMERSDEKQIVTTQEIIDYLAQQGISAERKSIYSDIDALVAFGLDIVKVRERPAGYRLMKRRFVLEDLKLISDAVQSTEFITSTKAKELIEKLEMFCSKREAEQLYREAEVLKNEGKDVLKTFGKSAEEEENVTLLCEKHLMSELTERFGKDIFTREVDEHYIQVDINIAVGRQFFGWLTGLGSSARIQSPEKTAIQYKEYLQKILENY